MKNENVDLVEVIEQEEKNEIVEVKKSNLISKNVESTLQDKKLLFNLNDHVDYKLNDCENQEILIKNIVIKTFVKELTDEDGEIVYNDKTGEVVTTKSVVTILLNEKNESFVTASKFFAHRVKDLIECYDTPEELKEELKKGIKIKILKTEMPDSKNKYLTFKLL